MVKCPRCKKDINKPEKIWTYGHFEVRAFLCNKCGTQFREYTKDGEHSFTLKLKKGKGFIKA